VPDFSATRTLIQRAIDAHVFPGAVIEVGTPEGVLWHEPFGRVTYAADSPATRLDTLYDLASLTKVVATTTLVMRLVEEKRLRLSDRVSDWIPEWSGPGREPVTIRHLLAHSAGLAEWLPLFRTCTGRAEFEQAICRVALEYAPGSAAVYSDLGFILLGFIVEDAGRAPLNAQFEQVRRAVAGDLPPAYPRPSGDAAVIPPPQIGFSPPAGGMMLVAPTEFDPWRGRLLVGEVHDENCWALGGVAGHAGLFGTAAGVGAFARSMLCARLGRGEPIALPETVAAFTERQPEPGSTRALGWDTMAPTSSCGTRMSPAAFGHTGFTGTSLWIDPAAGFEVVLLTNRVHPSREGDEIRRVRPAVHDSVVDAVERA
jgi:CubicO group peptidase (beta-lactamase class C family)